MGRSQTFPIFVLRVTLYLRTQFPSGGWKIIIVSFQPTPPSARILHVHVLIQSPTLVPGKNFPYKLHFVDFFSGFHSVLATKGFFISKPVDSKTGPGPAIHSYRHEFDDSPTFLSLGSKPNVVRGM